VSSTSCMCGSGVRSVCRASLRFDLRGHGESEGRQKGLTLSVILNNVGVAVTHVREATARQTPACSCRLRVPV